VPSPRLPPAPTWPAPALGVCAGEVSYLLNREVVDKVVVVFVKVTVQRDAVALVEQVLERVDPLDSQGPLYPVLQVRVVKQHVEAERLGSDGDRLRGATCAGRRETAG